MGENSKTDRIIEVLKANDFEFIFNVFGLVKSTTEDIYGDDCPNQINEVEPEYLITDELMYHCT